MVLIREAKPEELRDLASVYRREYNPHNIFQGPEEDVLDYLSKLDVVYLVCVEQDKVVGGVAIVEKKEAPQHSVFRFKHFAVLKEFHDKEVPAVLLEAAEKTIGKGKIEMHIAESETPDIEFYMAQGYAIEGELSNHYRMGEKCYVLGKTV